MPDTMRPVRFDPEERIRFHAGAQTADEICLVGGLDELPRFEPYNRVYSYKPGRAEPWLYIEVDSYIRDVVSGRFEAGGPEFFALASSEGEIWVLGAPGTGFSEIIPGAGDLYEGALYGEIRRMRWIGDALYAVGDECQVHRRVGRFGTWEGYSAKQLQNPILPTLLNRERRTADTQPYTPIDTPIPALVGYRDHFTGNHFLRLHGGRDRRRAGEAAIERSRLSPIADPMTAVEALGSPGELPRGSVHGARLVVSSRRQRSSDIGAS